MMLIKWTQIAFPEVSMYFETVSVNKLLQNGFASLIKQRREKRRRGRRDIFTFSEENNMI